LTWRLAASALAQANADLQPPVALADLQRSSQPLKLNIRRLHMDAQVYQDVTVALESGRWRYPQPLVPAVTLTSRDLRANPSLFAQDHHLVLMSSAPGHVEEFALRLEARNYRFCVDKQDEGADQIVLLDPSNVQVLALRAGDACGTFKAEQGRYQLRQIYGGTGASRTLFLRQTPARQALLTRPPSGQRAAVGDSGVEEYWGILASFRDPVTQRVTSSGFLGAILFLGLSEPCTFGVIEARVQATSLVPDVFSSASHLFDRYNFFKRVDSVAGTPVNLGGLLPGPFCVGDSTFSMEKFPADDFPIAFPFPAALNYETHRDRPAPRYPILIDGFSPERNTFTLQGSVYGLPPSPLGFPAGPEYEHNPAGGMQALLPDQVASSLPEYRVVLRYRPGGFPGNAIPSEGQVALFNSRDCSGPAMVVDRYDLPGILPGGPLGDFNGSVKLGAFTSVKVFSGLSQTGEVQQLNRPGCIASGWGASGWKAASLAVNLETVEMVVSTNQCEQCNLNGIDLAGRSLKNIRLYGASLNNAHLAGADLSGADLRYASLQGAQLPNANLDAANLCAANLNAAPSSAGSSNVAANLNGAFLRNAYLYGANLAGANFGDASFFSTSAGSCQANPCDSYHKPACASAYSATLQGTKFSNAYLAGVDMSNVAGSAADFSNAVLNGAWFRNATLTPDVNGKPVNFGNAFLQGADFTAANLVNAIFSNAYVDTRPSGGCMQFELGAAYTSFPGFSVLTPPGSNTCARAAAPAPTCVQFTYNRPTILAAQVDPPTIPLSQASPRNTSCASAAPLCGDAFTGAGPNTCWSRP
ncbi:MAG: pentapeptide repeat protein, partial [Polaromonas sp.]|nr:pentapeptide repeat protein [Polaromonas sp.]